ncbi:MAG: hypothetical protein NWQ54_08855 [Paraglaciecola sp.]|uniref:hypothetical protein n=1 Tax=Paraglaciecola sp. TaxID=1920173 RepID=UPI00273FF370|nr:hypothetical protein [Paraglaciecola sp.]MDP5029862.1 hypothetical protein [Paraglaciecola sp.]MDP5130982.1 hypothetical protein [Paraglaciecola sp.]
MSVNFSSNVNAAIVNGQLGLSRASAGLSQNALNIAQLSTQSQSSQSPQEFLANAVKTQLGTIKQTLPPIAGGISSELVGLSVNSINAQASAKVLDTANDSIGTILDILA